MLNRIWGGFFLVAFAVAAIRSLAFGATGVWAEMVAATFELAKTGFEIALGLTGVMCLWLGIMKLGERGGAVDLLGRALEPLLVRLFPGVPKGHPANGSMVMNLAANMLGLDNAATPLGLKAMKELQELNPETDTASNDQILFLVINTAAVTLIPATIFVYRAQLGAADPTDVFIPLLIATYCSTLVGLLATAMFQKLRLWDGVVLAYLGTLTAVVAGIALYFSRLDPDALAAQSSLVSNFTIFTVIVAFIALAAAQARPALRDVRRRRQGRLPGRDQDRPVPGRDAGGDRRLSRQRRARPRARRRARAAVAALGVDTRWVDGLPTALMRTLSGSGARGVMLETMKAQGADSFAGRLVSIVQGSTETTFYVLAVYFGSVGIRKSRHAVACGLIADLGGFVAAVLVCYLFFG